MALQRAEMKTHNCFTVLWTLSGTTRVSRTRRNIHTLTCIVVISHPLSASSIYYDLWHPPCSTYLPDSHFPQSHSKFSMVYLLPGTLITTLCLKKNDTDVTHYRFNTHQPILVIFGRDVAKRVCYQMVIYYPTSPH